MTAVSLLLAAVFAVFLAVVRTQVGMQQWLAGMGAVMTAKLASSIDDVLWLSSFLTPLETRRPLHVLIYVFVCLVSICMQIDMSF